MNPRLSGAALIVALLITSWLAAPAAAQDPPPILQVQAGDFPRGFTTDQIRTIQRQLTQMSIDPGPVDGVAGPLTRNGINAFTSLALVDIPRAPDFERRLVDLIAAYAGVAVSRHRDDWRTIVESDEFQAWIDENMGRVDTMRRSGTTDQIVVLLDEYVTLKLGRRPAAPAPQGPTPHDIRMYESKPLTLAATKNCACLHDLGGKTVYGFVPFWQAGPEPITLDFSVLSRIGYFAVPLDDDGVGVSSRGHFDVATSDFVNEARRYDTQVDIVVYNDQWERWRSVNAGFIDRLASHLSDVIQTPIRTTLLNRLIPIISLRSESVPTLGDGMTFYADLVSERGRPAAEQQAVMANVRSLLREVRRRITLTREDRQVNLLVRMSDLVARDGVATVASLIPAVPDIDNLLVLMDVGAADANRALRQAIEEAVERPDDQRTLLRKTIPVLDPTAPRPESGPESLREHLVYFEDNFGGIGFLPEPLAANTAVTAAATDVLVAPSNDFLGSIDSVCTLVCPNGWWFIAAFEVTVFAGFVVTLLWMSLAEVRLFFDRWWLAPWAWALLLFIVGGSLYLCDSFFRGYRDELFIAFVIGLALFGWLKHGQRRRETSYP